jgi:hypothetical protein
MKTYLIKFSDREEGQYDETQVAQMFANGRVDRNTPCKPSDRAEWKSIDDYLPMLKYGTQLPPPTKVPAVPPNTAAGLVGATSFSGGFRYSVRLGSEDHVQMDGGSVRFVLLLLAGQFCSLVNCGGDIRGTI